MDGIKKQSVIGDDAFFSFTRKDLFLKLVLLFPITTLFQYHISALNKLLFFVVLLVLCATSQLYRKPLVYLGCVLLHWLIVMLITPMAALRTNVNMALYYIFCVAYFVFFLNNKQETWDLLLKNHRFILCVVVLYTAILTVSIFLPSSYDQMNSGGWGDSAYFMSISGSPNRVGPASLFVVILIAFLLKIGYSKLIVLLALPQLYTFLMGGSRTYFVLGMCAFVILYYIFVNNKRVFYLSLIPLALVMLIITLRSSMMDKFLATFNSEATGAVFWQKLTNTRSIFWQKQLQLFFDTPLVTQIFGNGINFTTYRYGLWAHSDFIEILCSYGYVGLLNYLCLMVYSIRTLLKTKKKNFFIKLVCVFIWFFNAFFNFFYCYFCAMLSYPILLLLVNHVDENCKQAHWHLA